MISTLLAQVKQYRRVSWLAPLFTMLEAASELTIPLLMASIIDKGINAGDLNAVFRYGALMLLAAGVSLLFGILAGVFAAQASAGFAANLRNSLFAKIQEFSFSNIDKYSVAGLVTRLTTDVTHVQMAFQMVLRLCVRSPVVLIVALFMAFSINAKISLVFVAAIVFLTLCLGLIMARAAGLFEKVFKEYDALNASVQENVSAIRVVKSFVREKFETEKFTAAVDKLYHMFVKAEGLVSFNISAMMFAMYGCILALNWFGGRMIVFGTLTTGDLASLLSYVMSILMSLMMLSMVFVIITMSSAGMKRIAEVLNEAPDIVNPPEPVFEMPQGSVRFENVGFRYRCDSEGEVLQGIDFEILDGETVGIIGATGSGKTSLVSLISRLYDASTGRVLVGGIDVRRYDLTVLRNNVAVVLQKNVLFSGTVLENLRWGNPNATLEDCRNACRIACADSFVEKLPQGYDTMVEQGGANLSGGQRQRLCIARAILKNPKILILDDSTSAVDTATDRKIRNAFRTELAQTTKIIIAQRIQSVADADRIIVLDNGTVSAMGTHEQLLAHSSIYREIFEEQSGSDADFDKGED